MEQFNNRAIFIYMNFLHIFSPDSILLEIGSITIYWYGFFMVLALLAGLLMSLKIAQWHEIKKEVIYDLFFYLIIGGFIGARIFYILYNPVYFWHNPLDIFKIWQGGIAIHGALVFGFLVLIWFAYNPSPKFPPLIRRGERVKRGGEVFWKFAAIIAPSLALGQAIGRWGNYFNQELFGLPTDLPWGIPIALVNRPTGFEMFTYFHPTFLYESLGNLIIFGILIAMHIAIKKKEQGNALISEQGIALALEQGNALFLRTVLIYLFLYSSLRFFIEFLRIDPTAGNIGGMRVTQGLSLLILTLSTGYLIYLWRHGNIIKALKN